MEIMGVGTRVSALPPLREMDATSRAVPAEARGINFKGTSGVSAWACKTASACWLSWNDREKTKELIDAPVATAEEEPIASVVIVPSKGSN